MFRQLVAVGAVTVLIAVSLVPVAAADPVNAKNVFTGHAVCGGASVDFVVNGNGTFAPAHVIGSTSMFIPTAFNLVFTFTPTGGSPMSEPETSAKAAPIRDTVTCTIPLQTVFSGPEGTGTLQGTVTGFFTPRG